jgi:hypothetical protein
MHKSTLANEFPFKIEPDDHGGRTKTVTIQSQNISEPPVAGKNHGERKSQALISSSVLTPNISRQLTTNWRAPLKQVQRTSFFPTSFQSS